jgi:hypothetical protein
LGADAVLNRSAKWVTIGGEDSISIPTGVKIVIVCHQHEGRWYVVEFPEGTKAHRSRLTGMMVLSVPWEGRKIPIFDEPSELIVRLADAGKYGLRLLCIEPQGVHGSHDPVLRVLSG